MPGIDDIKNALVGGGARDCLFRVIAEINNFPFLCKAASIPESKIGSVKVPYMGRSIKVSGDRDFGTWETTIINDETFQIRHVLESWMSAIQDHRNAQNNYGTSNPEAYKSMAIVQQLSKSGGVLREYRFVGLWPQVTDSIMLDWSKTDAIEEFKITWEYDYWEVSGGQTGTIQSSVASNGVAGGSGLSGGLNVSGGNGNISGGIGVSGGSGGLNVSAGLNFRI